MCGKGKGCYWKQCRAHGSMTWWAAGKLHAKRFKAAEAPDQCWMKYGVKWYQARTNSWALNHEKVLTFDVHPRASSTITALSLSPTYAGLMFKSDCLVLAGLWACDCLIRHRRAHDPCNHAVVVWWGGPKLWTWVRRPALDANTVSACSFVSGISTMCLTAASNGGLRYKDIVKRATGYSWEQKITVAQSDYILIGIICCDKSLLEIIIATIPTGYLLKGTKT